MPGERFDAVVIGAGPGGRSAVRALAAEGMRVAIAEQELVGGECPFWACIPTKTLLRPGEVRAEAAREPGVATPAIAWPEVHDYLEYMISGLDDTKKTRALQEAGVEVVRGPGRVAAPGAVEVDGRRLETERVVVGTGTAASIPEIDGIGDVDAWTSREAATLTRVPASAVVLGAGPVGVELGQMLARLGCEVTLAEPGDCALPAHERWAREHVARALEGDGVTLRGDDAGSAEAVRRRGGGVAVRFADGSEVAAERLVVATGRRPRVEDLGLQAAGVHVAEAGIVVDQRCRAARGVWAVGDVTGVAPFTHVASYQGRVAAADMLGRPSRADYRAVPRVVFSDPEVAQVGRSPEQAEEDGVDVVSGHADLGEAARSRTFGRGHHGGLRVHADRERRVLVGATAVGPLASEWIGVLGLAVKAEVRVEVLLDSMFQFPTFSELVLSAVRALDL
jgi:pyruvate/2-oxoglutarate dehydrogenase complex dihydrolipoamide dehydrogenase (E3) component